MFHTFIHPYIHTCMLAYMFFYWYVEPFSKEMYIRCKKNVYIYIYTYMCVCRVFSRIHIQEAEVPSVRFPKEYDHINLAAKHSKLCTYFIQNSVDYVSSIHISIHIHTYIHLHIRAHVLIVWTFFQRHVYTYICVLCVILMFSRIHIPEAEVLSVRFPEEYDHIKLAAKHPKLGTYFSQNSVCLWFFSPYPNIHPYIHPHIHAHLLVVWFLFQKDMYMIYIYILFHENIKITHGIPGEPKP